MDLVSDLWCRSGVFICGCNMNMGQTCRAGWEGSANARSTSVALQSSTVHAGQIAGFRQCPQQFPWPLANFLTSLSCFLKSKRNVSNSPAHETHPGKAPNEKGKMLCKTADQLVKTKTNQPTPGAKDQPTFREYESFLIF